MLKAEQQHNHAFDIDNDMFPTASYLNSPTRNLTCTNTPPASQFTVHLATAVSEAAMDLDDPLALVDTSHIDTSSPTLIKRRVRRRLYIPSFARETGGVTSNTAPKKTLPNESMQSITCTPGLRDASFEELRFECYLQTYVATGRPPAPSRTGSVIPPVFLPFIQENNTALSEDCVTAPDVNMSFEPALEPNAFTFKFYASDTFIPNAYHNAAMADGNVPPAVNIFV